MRALPPPGLRGLLVLVGALGLADSVFAQTCAPSAREAESAVWTGTELIVWGGLAAGQRVNTGARYDPVRDRWTTMSTVGAPAPRALHTAVWTGHEMIVWGGDDATGVFGTGGRYDPATDTWRATTLTGIPAARSMHSAVWTGSGMLVHGGFGGPGAAWDLTSSAIYDPLADRWSFVPEAPEARRLHGSVWTPDGLLAWGGYRGDTPLATGARYDPSTRTWSALATDGAPYGIGPSLWTGHELLSWAGARPGSRFDIGFRYDPAKRAWSPLPAAKAPSARRLQSVVWTGTEAIVWGGYDDHAKSDPRTGARLDLAKGTWKPLATRGAPAGRREPVAVWTGTQMLVWGGFDNVRDLPDGARYDPRSDAWSPMGALCADLPAAPNP
jgi:hypothetical protein